MLTGHFGLQLVASTSSSQFFIVLGRAFRSLGFLGWAAWYSLVASMMRRKCSGPLVQVKGVGFWLYFFRCRSSKSFNSFLERWTLCVNACLVRMLKKHSAGLTLGPAGLVGVR